MNRRTLSLSACALLTGALALTLYAQDRVPRRAGPRREPGAAEPAPPPPPPATQPGPASEGSDRPSGSPAQPTRIQIDVFDLTCTSEQLIRFNPDVLYRDGGLASPEVLQQLREIGQARLLVRVHNTLDLSKPSQLNSGVQMPTIQDVAVAKSGTATPNISYVDIGFKATLSGAWRENGAPATADLRCEIQVSNVMPTNVKVSGSVTLPAFIKWQFAQSLTVASGQPVFLVANSLPGSGNDAPLSVAVVRLVVTRLPG